MARTLEFCFDFVSPMSYLAWPRLDDLIQRTGSELRLTPIILGLVMKETGNNPPVLVPAKGKYYATDIARHCQRFGIPFSMNPAFPMDTRRLLTMAEGLRGDPRFEAFIELGFSLVWRDGIDVSDRNSLDDALRAHGYDVAEMSALAEDDAARATLKDNTDKAIARGAFGAPTFFVGDDMFFGQDRFDFIEDALTARAWVSS